MANSKLNKIVTKVMDDIQDGTTKCEHCPYCGEKNYLHKKQNYREYGSMQMQM